MEPLTIKELENIKEIIIHPNFQGLGREGKGKLNISFIIKMGEDSYCVTYKCENKDCKLCNEGSRLEHSEFIRSNGYSIREKHSRIEDGKSIKINKEKNPVFIKSKE